jgi:hypothetical protein
MYLSKLYYYLIICIFIFLSCHLKKYEDDFIISYVLSSLNVSLDFERT